MKLVLSAALLALAPLAAQAQIALPPCCQSPSVSPAIQAALADPGRPDADKARDAARHPAEILAFAGIERGDKIGDFIMGGGYRTRILAAAVGPQGHVYGFQPSEFAKYGKPDDKLTATYPNATVAMTPAAEFAFAGPLDAILTFQNWHDLHTPAFTTPDFGKVTAKKLYDALKPGGVLLVSDHVANADPGMTAPDSLHRIDPAAVRADIEAAGFKFDGELAVLRNPADDHTAKVFDPSIRGKTDQFVYRFRKPE